MIYSVKAKFIEEKHPINAKFYSKTDPNVIWLLHKNQEGGDLVVAALDKKRWQQRMKYFWKESRQSYQFQMIFDKSRLSVARA